MHKNWVVKRYDQSVTCLADDPRNLGIRSSKDEVRVLYRKQTYKQAHNKYSSNARVKLK